MTDHDWAQDLIHYTQDFVPDITTRIKPADLKDIEALAVISGLSLPGDYRKFLESMGNGQGPILYEFRANISLADAIEFYEETPEESRPANHLVIGQGMMNVYQQISLNVCSDPAEVVNTDDEFIGHVIASDLPHLLFQQAFLHFELYVYPNTRKFGSFKGKHDLSEIRHVISQAGFSFRGFSDEYTICGFMDNCRIAAHQISGGYGWITLAGSHAPLIDDISRHLKKHLHIKQHH